MLRNYLLVGFRALWRNKVHSSINIAGLSLGIACCLLIMLFVRDEWTFDQFHTKADRIFRSYLKEDYGANQQFFNTVTPLPLGPALKENFAEVESQVRVSILSSTVNVNDQQFNETITMGGQDFFRVFDFPVTKGNAVNSLQDVSGVVITERLAKKYFGNADPINKIITIQLNQANENFSVKAVLRDIPINSSIQFDLLISDLNYPKLYSERALTSAWFSVIPETYVLLKENVDYKNLESKFPPVFRSILGEERFTESKFTVGLQPMTEIHLDTTFPAGIAPVSNPRYAYILSAAALLILFVACINFVTLSVGRSIKRAKEVGVRKVAGAMKQQLILQFVGEAVIVTGIALVIGILTAVLCLPVFNQLSGKNLSLEAEPFTLLAGLSMIIIIGLFAGSYPAFVLSNVKPVATLKGAVSGIGGGQRLRKILVGLQLMFSIFLISSTLIMQSQLEYLQNKNLGFSKDQLAVVQINVPQGGSLPERIRSGFEKVQQFKNELSGSSGIIGVCGSSHDFGNGAWTNIGYTDDAGTYRNFNVNVVEPDYFSVLRMNFSAGRNFDVTNPSDARRGLIVNEAFVKELGWKDAIGKRIPGKNFTDHEIIGVVKDFNYSSLYTAVQPLAIVMNLEIINSGIENISVDNSPIPKLLIRMQPENMAATIHSVKEVWNTLTGNQEFVFTFVDQALAAQYRNDQNLGKIIRITTLLAIVIGSLGLYGLASLAMQSRTKEVSIRKVLGATEKSLLILLSKEYVYLVGTSLLISIPVTWYLMREWLKSFEYRISIGLQSFLLAGIASLVVAILVISHQVIKTASAQPAETLRQS